MTSAPKAPLLAAESLSYSYGNLHVFDKLSFALDAGGFVTLLGPSGCGKTTLLNLIAGFLRPTGGELKFNGRPIDAPGPDRAVVFQSGALFEWLTVRNNIEFSLRCRGIDPKERRKVSDEMIELVGLRGFEDRYPYQLSGGMQQRVGVARVIAANPRIMLMDEPFAAVDVQTREMLQEELLRIHQRTGCTIVFVTHSIEEAVFLSDRIFLLFSRGSASEGIRLDLEVQLPKPRWDEANRLHPEFLKIRQELYVAMRER